MDLSDTHLRRVLGGLWLLDGLLQFQPRMFTADLANSVMAPTIDGQPTPFADGLSLAVQVVADHPLLANLVIALVQIALGLALLTGYRVNAALLGSVGWSLVVWVVGEGCGGLLTGQASVLTGAPGAVVFYAVLALALLPRAALAAIGLRFMPTWRPSPWWTRDAPILPRTRLYQALAAFWLFGALLQLQPVWWQEGHLADTIGDLQSPGTLGGVLIDPSLRWLARVTRDIQTPLNLALILVYLALAAMLATASNDQRRHRALLGVTGASLLLWWGTEAFGVPFSGLATDINSGPLLVVITLSCWSLPVGAVAGTRKRRLRGTRRAASTRVRGQPTA